MSDRLDSMIGTCAAMQRVFATIEKLAPTSLAVLVLGETGTGKELVARSLHSRSGRSGGPFVALNCAALPTSLVESELFGFEKGAFTGAVAARAGHIEQADGGTLFLDEIADMPLGAQAKLLRVVQDKRVQRVGATRDRVVDVRIIAATHQDLPVLVESGGFRRDLFHRLDETRLQLPPLRERGDDIERIAAAVLERLGRDSGRTFTLEADAQEALRAYGWPGNVRELENALRRATARTGTGSIRAADLWPEATQAPRTLREIVDRATEGAVRASLRRHRGDQTRVATELAIPLAELRALTERLQIREPRNGDRG